MLKSIIWPCSNPQILRNHIMSYVLSWASADVLCTFFDICTNSQSSTSWTVNHKYLKLWIRKESKNKKCVKICRTHSDQWWCGYIWGSSVLHELSVDILIPSIHPIHSRWWYKGSSCLLRKYKLDSRSSYDDLTYVRALNSGIVMLTVSKVRSDRLIVVGFERTSVRREHATGMCKERSFISQWYSRMKVPCKRLFILYSLQRMIAAVMRYK